jgi:DinB superfamily
MTFSNPAGQAVAASGAYTRALLEMLGTRDPFDVLEEQVPWLEARLSGIADPVIRRPEAPGKWAVIEVVQHLADTDMVLGFRTRMALSEDRPALQGYDQERWAVTGRYRSAPLNLALNQLRALRTANLWLWRSLSGEELERAGRHSERGEESIIHMVRLGGGHDLVHRRQIDRILAKVQGQQ